MLSIQFAINKNRSKQDGKSMNYPVDERVVRYAIRKEVGLSGLSQRH